MRYKKEVPDIYSFKKVTKFLFFPKKIKLETRWLETASWYERYYGDAWGWYPTGWANE